MISSPVIGSIIEIKIQSQQEWQYALEKIKANGICGLVLDNADIDSSGHKIKIISLALPDRTVYISDCSKLEQEDVKEIVGHLFWLLGQRGIKKVIYNVGPALAIIREAAGRMIDTLNVFDLMLASQICWSGYYYLTPCGSFPIPGREMCPTTACPAWPRDIWASFWMEKAALKKMTAGMVKAAL